MGSKYYYPCWKNWDQTGQIMGQSLNSDFLFLAAFLLFHHSFISRITKSPSALLPDPSFFFFFFFPSLFFGAEVIFPLLSFLCVSSGRSPLVSPRMCSMIFFSCISSLSLLLPSANKTQGYSLWWRGQILEPDCLGSATNQLCGLEHVTSPLSTSLSTSLKVGIVIVSSS